MRIEATGQITQKRPDKTPPDESRQDLVNQDFETGNADSGTTAEPSRALVLTAPQQKTPRPHDGRQATFLAHLIATREQAPQTRERRRAEPGDAIAAYRAVAGLARN